MFWADEIAGKLDKEKNQLVDDAWSASGFAHVGSLRGLLIHEIANKALINDGLKSRYTFILDDIDPMDGMPVYLDSAKYLPEMGKPLFMIPSPVEGKSLAEYFSDDFKETAKRAGAYPEFLRMSEIYKSGKMNDCVKEALDNTEKIKEVYKKVSGAERPEKWYPFQPICEVCGKIGTTTVTGWDGKEVTYVCEKNKVDWAAGCGHEGKISPYNGSGKLYWRVEWPARWKALGVTVEGEGKDHWAAGGSREMADKLTREVFNYPSPQDVRYDFFVIGGKKMSSSKGLGVTAKEISEILPKEVLRYLMAKNPRKVIEFDPSGVTIPNLFDDYDRSMKAFETKDSNPDLARSWEIVQESNFEAGYRMRFSKVALISQMHRIDLFDEAKVEKGANLSEYELTNLNERLEYAKKWLEKYAPADFIFKIQETTPKVELSAEQKRFLLQLQEAYNERNDWSGEELHARIHELKKDLEIQPKDAFSAIYLAFLGKDSGPQAGWLLASVDKELLNKRIDELTR